jgi:beta-lactamase superfamily II metal-dependent hydrolase
MWAVFIFGGKATGKSLVPKRLDRFEGSYKMTVQYLNKKTHPFHFLSKTGEQKKYVLIFGDEVEVLAGPAPSGTGWQKVKFRGRDGEMKTAPLTSSRSLEMYFLDVGQGDAAFITTPSNEKILVDGGLNDRALGFLIWKYRLDDPNNHVTIDYMIVSHGDDDHIGGLIPVLKHNSIQVNNILHNGIAVFSSGFNESLGNVDPQKRLTTLYDTTADLAGLNLSHTFEEWLHAVNESGATYHAVNSNTPNLVLQDVKLEFLGPLLEPGGGAVKWFGGKGPTINGHSVIFRLIHDQVRVLFTGDINERGAKNLMSDYTITQQLNSHVLKAPHHGSHDFYQPFFSAVNPMITIVSSGDDPDHGHPRAIFLGGVGREGRGDEPLLFSTEIAATFLDENDPHTTAMAILEEPSTLSDLDFSEHSANFIARLRFKQVLPGIINVRSSGEKIFTARRVNTWYQWEAYEPRSVTG